MSAFVGGESFQYIMKKWPGAVLHYLRNRYYNKLVYISVKRTLDLQASEEIVQEALIEVWKKSNWLAKQDGLLIAPYLLKIVKNKSITFYHQSLSRKEEHQPDDLLDEFISLAPSIEAEIIKADDYKRLRAIVSGLPNREKSCIELKYFDGMSNDAIATALGISKKTVEKYLTRGIRNLQAQKEFIG